MGPLKRWPRAHLILALSSGPSLELRMYRYSASAASPHRVAPSLSMYALNLWKQSS
jgi:hypothetical protein